MKYNLSILSIMLLLLFAGEAHAQGDTTLPWDYSGVFQINFQQVHLRNWQGGGENTIAGGGFTELNANYIKNKDLWTNRLMATYGIIRQGNDQQPFRKSDDNIHFVSNYTHEFAKNWHVVALLDAQTFLTRGYQFEADSQGIMRRGALLSSFFSPAYAIAALGVEFKPSNIFYALLSPVSTKLTFVSNDSMARLSAYGVDSGKNFRAEFGATFKSLLKWQFVKNAELQNEINLFGNYKDLKAIDVDEKVQLLIKAGKYLTAKAAVNVLYDQDVDVLREDGTHGPDTQVKQDISLGLQYSF